MTLWILEELKFGRLYVVSTFYLSCLAVIRLFILFFFSRKFCGSHPVIDINDQRNERRRKMWFPSSLFLSVARAHSASV